MRVAELKQNYAFSIKEALERAVFLFEEKPIEVKFTKEFSGVNFAGIKVETATKGQKITLPLFLARILHKQGVVEYLNDPSLALSDLHAKQWEQERTASLQELPEHLYLQLVQKLKEINETIRTNPSGYLIQERQRSETAFRQLLLDRENKILRNLSSSFIPTVQKNLTVSECVLIEYLVEILKEWENQLLGINHGEE